MNVNRIKQITFSLVTILVLAACGGGGGGSTPAGDTGDTTKSIAINSIKAYAANRSSDTPTVQTYLDAGVQGVTSENLTALNNLVDGLEAEDVDTVEEINALAATLGINIVPVAHAQTVTLVKGSSKAITLTATDAEGNALTYMVVSQPTHGTLSGIAPNLTYIPTVNYNGDDSFTFKVNDGTADSAVVAVSITVNAVAEESLTLLKTGQTIEYESFDDGYYKKGTARSYTRDASKNVVIDNATGLMWQDDIDAQTIKKNHADAITYCTDLTLGTFTDWRLPSIEELVYLTDKGRRNPALDPVFENVILDAYWSSTLLASDTNYVWIVLSHDGNDFIRNGKTTSFYIRCVRDGQ